LSSIESMINGVPMAALPDGEGVAKIFSSLLRREVEVKAVKPTPDASLVIAGHYVNGAKTLVGGCLCDKALLVFAGAAFSLIPADVAKESLKAKEIDEYIVENFAEVLNICSRLFEGGSDKRITLTTIEYPGASRSEATVQMLKKPVKRLDLELDIQGYGAGRIALSLLPSA
jgi:hypothetical protein